MNVTSQILSESRHPLPGHGFQFFYGWTLVHSDWGPIAYSYSELVGEGFWGVFRLYLENWISPILALAIFALFGLTSEARATYWRGFFTLVTFFGWKHSACKDRDLGEIKFSKRPLTTTKRCVLKPLPLDFLAHLFQIAAELYSVRDRQARCREKVRMSCVDRSLNLCADALW
jgi:hypothetical protein